MNWTPSADLLVLETESRSLAKQVRTELLLHSLAENLGWTVCLREVPEGRSISVPV